MDDQIKSFQICPRDTWAIAFDRPVKLEDVPPEVVQVHAIGLIEGQLIPYVIYGSDLVPLTYEHNSFNLFYGPKPTQGELEAFILAL